MELTSTLDPAVVRGGVELLTLSGVCPCLPLFLWFTYHQIRYHVHISVSCSTSLNYGQLLA